MLLDEHAKYHKLGPKDCNWEGKQCAEIAIARQTSALGEQCEIKVPIFTEDTREQMMDKIHMAYSIMQERMEDQNKVVMGLEAQSKVRANEETLRRQSKDRNKSRYEKELKAMRRQGHKEHWMTDKLEKEELDLAAKFNEAQHRIDVNPIEAPLVSIGNGAEPSPPAQGA